ncbi:hypothetical protein PGTUg99_017058 [Puccinia graminis f. sp. tritici]|uniref:Uncharacterized protein n=1 Tax=Puccinia graminis f. sp. tritici TaxID=56615 RepID=A0A5B0SCX6_PUCGR|nr:hypothetical protein PGTUg99_017058 [Puccinia graminis f. sp. tritici]
MAAKWAPPHTGRANKAPGPLLVFIFSRDRISDLIQLSPPHRPSDRRTGPSLSSSSDSTSAIAICFVCVFGSSLPTWQPLGCQVGCTPSSLRHKLTIPVPPEPTDPPTHGRAIIAPTPPRPLHPKATRRSPEPDHSSSSKTKRTPRPSDQRSGPCSSSSSEGHSAIANRDTPNRSDLAARSNNAPAPAPSPQQ